MSLSTMKRFLLVVAFSMMGISGKSIAEPYLFDLLDKPSYSKSWNAMFEAEENIDVWLTEYAETNNGTATPSKPVQIEDTVYKISTVCKANSCGSNMFYVVFSPCGKEAWGLLSKDENNQRFFGNPDDKIKAVLLAEAHIRKQLIAPTINQME